jgi:outer membrane immunogenic protein
MNRFIIAALPVLIASPALAGGVVPTPLEPAPVFVEPAAPAYDWTGFYVGAQASYADVEADGTINADGNGGVYGLRAGYDLDLGSTVVGGLVQYDTGSIGLDGTTTELDNILRVGGRVGFDAGRSLYYATAGYASADTSDQGSADGYFAGVGYEMFLTPAVSLGAEAIYNDFGELDNSAGTDLKATTVGLNVNYRF